MLTVRITYPATALEIGRNVTDEREADSISSRPMWSLDSLDELKKRQHDADIVQLRSVDFR